MALSDNLLAYYKLDESSGNATDATGNAQTLTNNNTLTYGTGLINNDADIGTGDSTKSLTRTDAAGWTGGAFTINLWININTNIGGNVTRPLFYSQNSTNGWTPSIEYQAVSGTDNLNFKLAALGSGGSGANNNIDSSGTFTIGDWHMCTITWDATTYKAYLDASLISSSTPTTPGSGQTAMFRLFKNLSSNSGDFRMDEVGWWSRAVSAAEVTSLYNGGAGLAYPLLPPTLVPSVADSTSVIDAMTPRLLSYVSTTDSATAADSVVNMALNQYYLSVSDSTAIADTFAGATLNVFSFFISEPTPVTDTPTILSRTQNLSVSDSTAMSEAVTMLKANTLSVSDSTTVTDGLSLSPFTSWTALSMDTSTWVDLVKN